MTDVGDIRYNGTHFEALISVTIESMSWSDAMAIFPRHLEPNQRREGSDVITETWVPLLTYLTKNRVVMADREKMAEPMTTEFEELVAEGWMPPGDEAWG